MASCRPSGMATGRILSLRSAVGAACPVICTGWQSFSRRASIACIAGWQAEGFAGEAFWWALTIASRWIEVVRIAGEAFW
jgi:hypothetical protein